MPQFAVHAKGQQEEVYWPLGMEGYCQFTEATFMHRRAMELPAVINGDEERIWNFLPGSPNSLDTWLVIKKSFQETSGQGRTYRLAAIDCSVGFGGGR
jgi:hypothetical protein